MAAPKAWREEGFAALVGIDWSDRKHDVVELDLATMKEHSMVIEQKPEALADWVNGLRQRYGGQLVAVCLEQTKGALIYHLLQYEFLRLYPVNPDMVQKYRKAFYPSGSKSDPGDAGLALEILDKHGNRLRVWKPDDEKTRLIGALARQRREAVEERVRLTNKLTAALKGYFPQALDLVGEKLNSPMACDFLLKWPTLEAAQAANPGELRKFYYGHHSSRGDLIRERIQMIKNAAPLTTDLAIVRASVMKVRMLAEQLRVLDKTIKVYEKEQAKLVEEHPDSFIHDSYPGAAEQLVPRLIDLFGSDRDRYEEAKNVQMYTGIAPVTRSSGKTKFVCFRFACPKFHRQTIHEFANCSRRSSEWAQAYYLMQRAKGKGHHAAVRALGFKWLRIMFHCWQHRVPYNEDIYLEALRRHGSPLLQYMDQVA